MRVHNVVAKDYINLVCENPHTITTGETADISNLCRFRSYMWVYYWDNTDGFPMQNQKLGRASGPTKNEDNQMAQYILQQNGTFVPIRTVKSVPPAHKRTERVNLWMHNFNQSIKNKLGDTLTPPEQRDLRKPQRPWIPYDEDYEEPELRPRREIKEDFTFPDSTVSMSEALINSEVLMYRNDDSKEL